MTRLTWPRNIDINLLRPVCTLCGHTPSNINSLTQILFESHDTETKDYCILVCTSNPSCATACLSKGMRGATGSRFKPWHADLNQLSREQICVLMKATQRTLTPADGGKAKIICPGQLGCFVCRWKMKSVHDLQAGGDQLWVLFDGDRVRWFCDSHSCRRALENGTYASRFASIECNPTIPAGSALSRWLTDDTVGTPASSCSASLNDTYGANRSHR
jgi:hypothetical protein